MEKHKTNEESKPYKNKFKAHKRPIVYMKTHLYEYDDPEVKLYTLSIDGELRDQNEIKEIKVNEKEGINPFEIKKQATKDILQINIPLNPVKGNEDQLITAGYIKKFDVFCGYQNGKIKCWDFFNDQFKFELRVHIKKIACLNFVQDRLISGSIDQSVILWDLELQEYKKVLKFDGVIDNIQVVEDLTYILVDMKTIYEILIRKDNTENIQKKINFFSCQINNFLVFESHVYIAFSNNQIQLYDLEKFVFPEDEEAIIPNILPLFTIEGDRGTIIDSDVDILKSHVDGPLHLCNEGQILYTSGYDCNVLSWDLNEIKSRIWERANMIKQDLWSKKHDAWYNVMFKKKKKGKAKAKKGKK